MSEGSTGIDNKNKIAIKIPLPRRAPEPVQDAINPTFRTENPPTIQHSEPLAKSILSNRHTTEPKQREKVKQNNELATKDELPEQNEKAATPDMTTITNLQMMHVSLEEQLHEPTVREQEEMQVETARLEPNIEEMNGEEDREWMLLQEQHVSNIDGKRYIYTTQWWAYSYPEVLQVNTEIMQSNNDRLHAINTHMVNQQIAYTRLYRKDFKELPPEQAAREQKKVDNAKAAHNTRQIPGKPIPWDKPVENIQTETDKQFVLPEVLTSLQGRALEAVITAMAKAEGVKNTQEILQSLGKDVSLEQINTFVLDQEKISQRATAESKKDIANSLKLKKKENQTVDPIALGKRRLLIIGKMIKLFMFNKNENFRFSGKDLRLSQSSPDGKSEASWFATITQIEKMEDMEYTALLKRALDLINNNPPMK